MIPSPLLLFQGPFYSGGVGKVFGLPCPFSFFLSFFVDLVGMHGFHVSAKVQVIICENLQNQNLQNLQISYKIPCNNIIRAPLAY